MAPIIIENHSDYGVNVGRIVKRIVKYAPPESMEELNGIYLLDKNPAHSAFGCYWKKEKNIHLYIADIIGWLPKILRKSFVLPYFFIAIALGHEIDHHVHRHDNQIDKEKTAESNALIYVYPSFGIFKPLVRLFKLLLRPRYTSTS